jgi:hypothetical protein
MGDVAFPDSFCAGYFRSGCPAFSLKQERCPHCACFGTLIRHSILYGNDPNSHAGQVKRGQRVLCSNRDQRLGCGRTFPIFLAAVLPRHTVTAPVLWTFILSLLDGHSIKASAKNLPFALETFYGMRRKLRLSLDVLRTRLLGSLSPPRSARIDPLLETFELLLTVFAGSACPIAAFALRFQDSVLG